LFFHYYTTRLEGYSCTEAWKTVYEKNESTFHLFLPNQGNSKAQQTTDMLSELLSERDNEATGGRSVEVKS